MCNEDRHLLIVRWMARTLSGLIFLFWLGFFIEHIQQWFVAPWPRTPPTIVWVNQLLHFLILAGLVIGWKWERVGGVLVIVASVLFLFDKAPLLILPTILPGILFLYCWWRERGLHGSPSAAA